MGTTQPKIREGLVTGSLRNRKTACQNKDVGKRGKPDTETNWAGAKRKGKEDCSEKGGGESLMKISR